MSAPVLYYVVPCYNEEAVILETARRLQEKVKSLVSRGEADAKSRIVFVNDGSSDSTWEKIRMLHKEDPVFSGINLSRNRGHQNALLAGLLTVSSYADVMVSLDADLQDDIDATDAMLAKYKEGKDIVYGVRSERKTDSFFKRTTASLFYKGMRMMGAETVEHHADFRLMSARAVKALAEYKEVNLFLRGMVPLLGFESDVVYYERSPRFAGESKYPLSKMLFFATQGVTSLTTKPIQLITNLGILIFLMSIVMLIYSLYRHFTGATITGWSSLMVSLWAIGGLILLSLGIIGEYIGKIYLETKERPRFIVTEYLDKEHGYVYGDEKNASR